MEIFHEKVSINVMTRKHPLPPLSSGKGVPGWGGREEIFILKPCTVLEKTGYFEIVSTRHNNNKKRKVHLPLMPSNAKIIRAPAVLYAR